jgi:integrase
MLYKWLHHERGLDEYDPEMTFATTGSDTVQRDFLDRAERKRIKEASLEYGSVTNYNAVTPEERTRIKRHLAQRFNKPMDEVALDDWDRANDWKYASLVWTSLDAGLRPVEVGRAKTSWVDIENQVLRIPRAESSKNEGNWIVSLTERTTMALDRWLHERSLRDRYDETDRLWMTMRGNAYGSRSLRRLLHRLCDEAGIDTNDRKMSWYSIRHSVGTLMTKERDLAATKAQLRHRSPLTTMKYDQVPVEDRRDALDRMG